MNVTLISGAASRLIRCRPKCRTLDEFIPLAQAMLQVRTAPERRVIARHVQVSEATVKGLVMVCTWALEFVAHVQASGRAVSLATVREVRPIRKADLDASDGVCTPTIGYRLGMGAAFLRDAVCLPDTSEAKGDVTTYM